MPMPHENFHEVWWIYADETQPYGGLRVAHFHKTVNAAMIFMISDEPPERMGVRIWDDVSVREGWHKVMQITVPTLTQVLETKT